MFVYLVQQWEAYEGGSTLSVHKTRRGAFKAVREYIASRRHSEVLGPWNYMGCWMWGGQIDRVAIFAYHLDE